MRHAWRSLRKCESLPTSGSRVGAGRGRPQSEAVPKPQQLNLRTEGSIKIHKACHKEVGDGGGGVWVSGPLDPLYVPLGSESSWLF